MAPWGLGHSCSDSTSAPLEADSLCRSISFLAFLLFLCIVATSVDAGSRSRSGRNRGRGRGRDRDSDNDNDDDKGKFRDKDDGKGKGSGDDGFLKKAWKGDRNEEWNNWKGTGKRWQDVDEGMDDKGEVTPWEYTANWSPRRGRYYGRGNFAICKTQVTADTKTKAVNDMSDLMVELQKFYCAGAAQPTSMVRLHAWQVVLVHTYRSQCCRVIPVCCFLCYSIPISGALQSGPTQSLAAAAAVLNGMVHAAASCCHRNHVTQHLRNTCDSWCTTKCKFVDAAHIWCAGRSTTLMATSLQQLSLSSSPRSNAMRKARRPWHAPAPGWTPTHALALPTKHTLLLLPARTCQALVSVARSSLQTQQQPLKRGAACGRRCAERHSHTNFVTVCVLLRYV